ncbi:hypothetical protein ACHWQZ_G002414 [Mnemiopsis leidyi]
MGAVLAILSSQAFNPIEVGEQKDDQEKKTILRKSENKANLPPLSLLPQEVAIKILSNLTATELCLAGCVISPWSDMTEDDILWFNLVKSEWKYAKYVQDRILEQSWQSFKKLYLIMDEAQLIFSVNPLKGIEYLQDHRILSEDASDIALYLHTTEKLRKEELCNYLLQHRPDVLEDYVKLEDYSNQSVLPNVLRNFLTKFPAKQCNLDKEQLGLLLIKFSLRYSECNPQAGLSQDIVYNICCSLMLLGYDFTHPLIKNKMSKREFIRNTREVTPGVSNDYLGHMYDNIYLIGPVVR